MGLEIVMGIEALVGLVFLFCLARRPACCGIIAVLVGMLAAYGIFNMWVSRG